MQCVRAHIIGKHELAVLAGHVEFGIPKCFFLYKRRIHIFLLTTKPFMMIVTYVDTKHFNEETTVSNFNTCRRGLTSRSTDYLRAAFEPISTIKKDTSWY